MSHSHIPARQYLVSNLINHNQLSFITQPPTNIYHPLPQTHTSNNRRPSTTPNPNPTKQLSLPNQWPAKNSRDLSVSRSQKRFSLKEISTVSPAPFSLWIISIRYNSLSLPSPLPLPLPLLLLHFPWLVANFLFQLFPLEKIVVQCQQSGLGIRRFEAG